MTDDIDFEAYPSIAGIVAGVDKFLGPEGIAQLLKLMKADHRPTSRESLKEVADQLKSIGLADLAATVRKVSRSAPTKQDIVENNPPEWVKSQRDYHRYLKMAEQRQRFLKRIGRA